MIGRRGIRSGATRKLLGRGLRNLVMTYCKDPGLCSHCFVRCPRDLSGRCTHCGARQLQNQSTPPLDAPAPSPGTLNANQAERSTR